VTTRGWFEATLQAGFKTFCQRLAEGRPASFQDFMDACNNYIAAEYGGMEDLRKYPAKLGDCHPHKASARTARVAKLVEGGAKISEIAQAESISERQAKRLRRVLRGRIGGGG
jgi:DNA-binding NarL/FixJ family response regulator